MKVWVLIACGLVAAAQAQTERRTGFDFMGPQIRAMQRDDSLNPGLLWVQDGLARWSQPDGAAEVACAGCHGATPQARLAGVAARYPAWDTALARPVTLAQRINLCRQRHQRAEALPDESDALLALEAALAYASRGLPMDPPADPRLDAARAAGASIWRQRLGQIGLSCAQCHDQRVGQRLAGSVIPPGNAVGYPTYRLEWQALGSLQRRLRNCMTGVRAEPFDAGGPEMVALQAWLAERDRGLVLQAPAVRP